MKKISLLTLMLGSGVALFAQNQPMGTMSPTPQLRTKMATATRFGLKAGVNLATFNVNDFPAGSEPNTNTKTSMYGGVFVNIPLSSMFRFQPELLYSGQGSKISQKVGTATQDYEQDLSYIALPLMLQLQSNSGVFVEAGPQLSYLIRARQDGPGSIDMENRDNYDKFDIGIGAGLGYLSRIGLGINARYNFGLSNILEDGGGNNSANNGPELKNKGIQIGLMYHIGANK